MGLLSWGRRFHTKRAMIKYVEKTSQRLCMLRRLNKKYKGAISEASDIERLAMKISHYKVNCRYLTTYKTLRSDRNALVEQLLRSGMLTNAVRRIYKHNERVNMYSRAAIRIFYKYSNERHFDPKKMSYQKYCDIESMLFSELFALTPVQFDVESLVSYSSVSKPRIYETVVTVPDSVLFTAMSLDRLNFDGVESDMFLELSDDEKASDGYYVVYNKTCDKFYIGYAQNVHAELRGFFMGSKITSVSSEFLNGDDFYVKICEADGDDRRDIYNKLRHLARLYENGSANHLKLLDVAV